MLQLKHVSKTYNKTKKAVDDITISIEPGQIVGFIGPNGAGKTTTLKMITGLLNPDSGTLKVNGFDIIKEALEAKSQFGFVSDDPNAYLKLKGFDFLNFIADMYDISTEERRSLITEYAKLLSLEDALNQKIASYSHGMRQKIMVIAALLNNPQLLILDEPLTGLDPQSSYLLKDLMKKRAQSGKSVFFSTHVLEVAEKLCDQIIIINHGKIIYTGTLQALKNDHDDLSLEEIFLELTK